MSDWSEGLTLDTDMNNWGYDPGWTENDWQSGFDLPGGGDWQVPTLDPFEIDNMQMSANPFQQSFFPEQNNAEMFGNSGMYTGLDPSMAGNNWGYDPGWNTTGDKISNAMGGMGGGDWGKLAGLALQFMMNERGANRASDAYKDMQNTYLRSARPAGAAGNPGQPLMGPNAQYAYNLNTNQSAWEQDPIFQQLRRDFEKQLATRLAGPKGQGLMSGGAAMYHTGGLAEVMANRMKMLQPDQIYQGNEAQMFNSAMQPGLASIGIDRSNRVDQAQILKQLFDLMGPKIFGDGKTNNTSLASRIFGA